MTASSVDCDSRSPSLYHRSSRHNGQCSNKVASGWRLAMRRTGWLHAAQSTAYSWYYRQHRATRPPVIQPVVHNNRLRSFRPNRLHFALRPPIAHENYHGRPSHTVHATFRILAVRVAVVPLFPALFPAFVSVGFWWNAFQCAIPCRLF